MNKFKIFTVAIGLVFLSHAHAKGNVNDEGIIAEGYDVVSYFQPKGPKKGQPAIKATHNGDGYLFSSNENRALFLKDPQKYVPQFDGWCAYAVADSKSKVEIDPKSFVIQNGRLLLFYNGFLADTRKKWTTSKKKTPEAFLTLADANWPETQKKEP